MTHRVLEPPEWYKQYTTYVIAIDPGTISMGYAGFLARQGKPPRLHMFGNITPAKSMNAYARALCAAERLQELFDYELSYASLPLNEMNICGFCELAVPYHGGAAGTQAKDSGSTLKLAFGAGMAVLTLRQLTHRILGAPGPTWKGQTPKRIQATRTANAMRDQVDLGCINHDAMDAIGMGLWCVENELPWKPLAMLRRRRTLHVIR
ncbi:MAG: crossover junction endodeoxyribonuclease RuvC [bacterium]|nr:crossover junction endodeoxyribonuclease RuvC [bacterium]